ncbi:MAG: cation efflux family transporter [Methylothermaceae bacteria B42]|nr:MAG: cation efflux family transporter [Methylothermaceae bacteria B42]HHJ38243.1 cation diffusion facilitator family transporter [Methylothermaceae bacterium]
MDSSNHSLKAIFYAFSANLGIAIAKTWAAFFTGSGSMLAEAIHSFADSGNQVLLYLGLKQAQRPPDQNHPLGYGKISYFWSFVVAILLFTMGGVFSIYEGWHKLDSHEGLRQPIIGILILLLSIALEGWSLRGCLVEVNRIKGDKTLWQWLFNTRNAELVVVLGEDTAALIGLSLALAGLGMATITGNPVYDAMGSIAIGVVLILISLFVALHIKALIIGRSAEPELEQAINQVIEQDDAIAHLFNLITLQLGPDVMVAAKLRMKPELTLQQAVHKINLLEVEIKRTVPQVKWCFMEPDCKD